MITEGLRAVRVELDCEESGLKDVGVVRGDIDTAVRLEDLSEIYGLATRRIFVRCDLEREVVRAVAYAVGDRDGWLTQSAGGKTEQ